MLLCWWLNNFMTFKIDVAKAECVFFNSFVYMLVCTAPPHQTKNGQTWNLANRLPSTISKNGFSVFSKKLPCGPQVSNYCRVTWIFRISPRLPSIIFIYFNNFYNFVFWRFMYIMSSPLALIKMICYPWNMSALKIL